MEVEASVSSLIRPDGRGPSECRRTFLRSGVVGGGATGSCYGEFSRTRVIVSVYGPRPKERDSLRSSVADLKPLAMELQCSVHLAGGQGEGDGERQEISRRMAQEVKQCILPSIQQDKLPKTCLELQCTILESDGCDIGPVVMCASVALASSNIPLFDLVTYCSLVSLEHQVLLDPTEQELRSPQSDAQVSVAYMPSRDQVNFVQASGDWSMHSFKDYMDTCLDGCKKMQPILRSCLVETMRTKQLDA